MFKGSIVAIVTPMTGGNPDRAKFCELLDWHIECGTGAIVAMGTTGEAATMSHEEDTGVTELAVKHVGGRIPVIAGSGSNSTKEALFLTEAAKKNGADAALVVTPYYNKPTQEGLYQHFKFLAENVDIPIILYQVPGRTGVSLAPETVARLAKMKSVVAIKAADTVDYAMQVMKSAPDFTVLSGDDNVALPMMAAGAKGVISVAANVIPREMALLCQNMSNGRYDEAREIHYRYFSLFKGLFIESNPIPVKAAMAMMGLIEEEYRLPLTPMGKANRDKLEGVMRELGLLSNR